VAGGRSYMDWLLTVPLLLIELILVMGLDDATTTEVKFTGLTQNLRVDPAV
jgi:bacteriorhodopsin